jgi:hypothetical protein
MIKSRTHARMVQKARDVGKRLVSDRIIHSGRKERNDLSFKSQLTSTVPQQP